MWTIMVEYYTEKKKRKRKAGEKSNWIVEKCQKREERGNVKKDVRKTIILPSFVYDGGTQTWTVAEQLRVQAVDTAEAGVT